MSQLHVWFVQLKQTEPVNVRSELQTSSPSDTQIGAKFTGCQWRWWITEHTCYLQFVQHWIQNYTKKIKKKSQKDVQWLQWQRHKWSSEVDKLNIDFRRPGLSSGMCRIWDTCDWVRLKSVCQFCSELHIVQPSDALQFVLLHSELQLQSGLSALDGRANAERAAAGHGPCRLFQPWSCHRLLSGCCPDPSRTLVRLAVSWSLVSLVSKMFANICKPQIKYSWHVFYLNSDAKLFCFRAFTSWKLYKLSSVCHNTRTTVQAAFMTKRKKQYFLVQLSIKSWFIRYSDCVLLTLTMFLCLLTFMQIFINVHLNDYSPWRSHKY